MTTNENPSAERGADSEAQNAETDSESAPARSAEPADAAEFGAGDPNLEERVESALRAVRDPEAGVNVFEAGLIESIDVDAGGETPADGDGGAAVTVGVAVDDLDAESGRTAMEATLRAVRDVPGVGSAHVEPVERSASSGSTGAAAFDRVIAVASAKGGVGKSTVATHLACALADGDREVALFDADVHGPNVPDLLDVSGPVRSDEDGSPLPVRTSEVGDAAVAGSDVDSALGSDRDLDSDPGLGSDPGDPGADPSGELEVMSVGLLESGAPLGWRGAMAHDAVSELFDDTAWRGGDVLVVDLPPGTGDVVLTTLQEVDLDGVVVVTTPFHASVSDTRRSVDLFRDNGVPVLGAVVNMARYVCDCCGEPNELFRAGGSGEEGGSADDGPAPDELGVDAPVLAELPFTAALQGTPTPGSAPEPVGDLADAVADRLATAGEVTVEPTADIRGLEPEARKRRVRETFEGLDAGDRFVLLSDRDPTPVRRFLARVADADREAFDPFEVRRATPDDWVLETVKP